MTPSERDTARAQQIAAALGIRRCEPPCCVENDYANVRHREVVAAIQQALAEVRAENPATPTGCVAFRDVVAERVRQDAKWGEQNHDPFTYLTVLIEEVGELAQAALHARFGGHAATKLREEAVQTAAVAVAIVECIDRDKWTFRTDVDNSGMPVAQPAPERREEQG